MLQSLELGNCDKIEPSSLFDTLKSLKNLKYLRLEKGKFDVSIAEMKNLTHLRVLELIDFEMVQGFGKGLVELQNIRKLLLIPTYTDEVSKNFVKSMYLVPQCGNDEIFAIATFRKNVAKISSNHSNVLLLLNLQSKTTFCNCKL